MPDAVTIAVPRRLIGLRVRAMKKLLHMSTSSGRKESRPPDQGTGWTALGNGHLLLLGEDPADQGVDLLIAQLDLFGVLLAVDVGGLLQEGGQRLGVLLDIDQIGSLHLLGLGG